MCSFGGHLPLHQWLLTSNTSVPLPDGFLWFRACWSDVKQGMSAGESAPSGLTLSHCGMRVGGYEPRPSHPSSVQLWAVFYIVSEGYPVGWSLRAHSCVLLTNTPFPHSFSQPTQWFLLLLPKWTTCTQILASGSVARVTQIGQHLT